MGIGRFSKWLFAATELCVYFAIQVVIANLQVAKLLFVRNSQITPAIVAIPLSVKSDLGLYVLSSMITLTPGTLSLDLSDDRMLLFVHVVHTDDPKATISEIQSGFERRVLNVFEGRIWRSAQGEVTK